MSPEELLKTLQDGGLDPEAIKKLLGDTLAMLDQGDPGNPPAPNEDEEKAQAGQLLGVTL